MKRYTITGISKVEDWYGNVGFIPTDSFEVNRLKEIPNNLTDGGFGVKKIIGGYVEVLEKTENGIEERGLYRVTRNKVTKLNHIPKRVRTLFACGF